MRDCGHPGCKGDAFEVLMARTEVGDLLFRGRPLRGLAVAGCFSRRRCSVVFDSYRVHQFKPNPISRTQQNSDTSAEITVRSGSERFDFIQQNIGVQNGGMWACMACKPSGFNIYGCLGGNQTKHFPALP
jgi:hypothetical protein